MANNYMFIDLATRYRYDAVMEILVVRFDRWYSYQRSTNSYSS